MIDEDNYDDSFYDDNERIQYKTESDTLNQDNLERLKLRTLGKPWGYCKECKEQIFSANQHHETAYCKNGHLNHKDNYK